MLACVLGLLFQLAPGGAEIRGERTEAGDFRQWHRVTLRFAGPESGETATPNPFTDYRLDLMLEHRASGTRVRVPGFYAADGDAGETSATSGGIWKVELRPERTGEWLWEASFRAGPGVAVRLEPEAGTPAAFDGARGSFRVAPSDKTGRDFRARGRLAYVGERYLVFAGDGEPFLKAGPDSPETLLAYADFDGTRAHAGVPLLTWPAHERDWRAGDPGWKDGKGKGLIGALNYMASKGCSSFSFIPYNAGGDGDNVWPFIERDETLRYDCSKLEQWNVVFDHATNLGLFCHFKTQENENDDNRVSFSGDRIGEKPEALDDGRLGLERKLYYRELVARFGHLLGLNWNLGEENTQSAAEVIEEAAYLAAQDPYDHLQVIHTYPYAALMGERSVVRGASLQSRWDAAHREVLRWIDTSVAAGRPWVVGHDEQNPPDLGVPPDAGYQGSDGVARDPRGAHAYTADDIRKYTLWGTLMAGGMGVEYYFGYQLPQNDLGCQDWRSRDASWTACGIALGFFAEQRIPVRRMHGADALLRVEPAGPANYCLADPGATYLIYLGAGGAATLDLGAAEGTFRVRWFDPRGGGALQEGSLAEVHGGAPVALGRAPADPDADWVVLLRRAP